MGNLALELSVSGLAVARGGIRVLEDVSFRLLAGRALILRGPNGVGKTTLLRTIAGLQPAVAGQVSLPPEAIAYAAHADGLKAVLTVEENLRFWAAIHGTREVERALVAMNLVTLRDRPAANLSAGQKRRLGLARLLVTGRELGCWMNPRCRWMRPRSRCSAGWCGRIWRRGGGADRHAYRSGAGGGRGAGPWAVPGEGTIGGRTARRVRRGVCMTGHPLTLALSREGRGGAVGGRRAAGRRREALRPPGPSRGYLRTDEGGGACSRF
jgi:heme ABC exporter ATP-binding subunit CcmA